MPCSPCSLVLLLPLTAALSTPPSFNEISSTSKGVKSLVSSLTAVVNSLGGAEQNSEPRQREYESLTADAVLEGLRRDFVENEYLWSGKIDPELYDEDAVFTDPTLSFSGLSTFEKNLENLDPWIERFVPPSQRSVELRSLKLVEDDVIEAEWRMLGDLALPWKPRLDLDGRTRYTLGGEGGRISSYDEAWAISPSAALAMLVKPYRSEADDAAVSSGPAPVEHWPGQLDGAAAPTPAVVLTDAPPFVVLPGFGNDAIDYVAPLEQDEAVGLTAALRRRGVSAVSVVPIARANWLNVLRGLLDIGFLTGDAQPDGPAFMWYLRKSQEAVEQAVAARRGELGDEGGDARVVLLGHSAGGWLARALCDLDVEWTRRHVRGLVSLGTPHLGPPPDVPDQVRGTVTNLNVRAPGAHLRPDGVMYVTVASTKVGGDDAAPPGSAPKIAFNSYRMVCGAGDMAGDGVVPLASAHLDGADAQLTLDCYHSINEAGTARPTDDWYGAEKRIDEWLGTVAEALSAQHLNHSLKTRRLHR